MKVLLIMSAMLFSVGCGSRLEEKRINNVVRLFWHEEARYSVHVFEPGAKEIEVIQLHPYMCGGSESDGRPKLIPDVPVGKPMWVRYVRDYNWNLDCLRVLEIHVRSEKDVEGGVWNHGKFGSGQTAVIR